MLPHYLGKLKVQICCVSESAPFQIESQRYYCPMHTNFNVSTFKTVNVLPAH